MDDCSASDVDENMSDESDMNDGDSKENQSPNGEVYLPGKPIEDGEELTFDKSAYRMYHAAQTGAPCLSFDIIENSSEIMNEYPMTCYVACGTQSHGKPNQILIMKMANLTKIEADSDSESSYIEDDENGPQLYTISVKHIGDINRMRCVQLGDKKLAAAWSSVGKVEIWDLTEHFKILQSNTNNTQHQSAPDNTKALFSFSGHQTEGYAMDWSPTVAGRLATGSCNKNIHLWQPSESGWQVDQRPLNAHADSVEDIQWSPNERNVLASCSVDQTIRIWDANLVGSKACMLSVKAHDADVNVISWNRNDPFILSGGDDGMIKVWDLRKFQSGVPVATFKHHTAPITSVEWNPVDSTVFAASGADDQVTIWDLAVEKDDESADHSLSDIPPQLLFIHMGQKDIKEIHWHRKLPGVIISTAGSGFNIFKTISV